jgi:hypothetical protein
LQHHFKRATKCLLEEINYYPWNDFYQSQRRLGSSGLVTKEQDAVEVTEDVEEVVLCDVDEGVFLLHEADLEVALEAEDVEVREEGVHRVVASVDVDVLINVLLFSLTAFQIRLYFEDLHLWSPNKKDGIESHSQFELCICEMHDVL